MVHPCTACEKDGNLACQGCLQSPPYLDDIPSSTWYCSAQCQKADWPSHKQRCKNLQNRKALHRAAHLIQELYNIVRTKSYPYQVEGVSYVNDKTFFVHLTHRFDNISNVKFHTPPTVPGSNSQADMKATMLYACSNAVSTMGQTVQIMLSSILPIIMESQVMPSNRKVWGFFVMQDGGFVNDLATDDFHDLFLIILENQERYALDLTHAQFGQENETIMPWQTYLDIRVHRNCGQGLLGGLRDQGRKLTAERFGETGMAVEDTIDRFEEILTKAIREIEAKSSGWMKAFKIAEETKFAAKVQQTLRFVTGRLDDFVEANTANGTFREWGSESERRALISAAESLRQEKVRSWGEDNRGPAFEKAMQAIEKRQEKEKKEWAKPNEIQSFAFSKSSA